LIFVDSHVIGRAISSKAKVNEFDLMLVIEQNVLRFEITMSESIDVDEVQYLHEIINNLSSFRFI